MHTLAIYPISTKILKKINKIYIFVKLQYVAKPLATAIFHINFMSFKQDRFVPWFFIPVTFTVNHSQGRIKTKLGLMLQCRYETDVNIQ